MTKLFIFFSLKLPMLIRFINSMNQWIKETSLTEIILLIFLLKLSAIKERNALVED